MVQIDFESHLDTQLGTNGLLVTFGHKNEFQTISDYIWSQEWIQIIVEERERSPVRETVARIRLGDQMWSIYVTNCDQKHNLRLSSDKFTQR